MHKGECFYTICVLNVILSVHREFYFLPLESSVSLTKTGRIQKVKDFNK